MKSVEGLIGEINAKGYLVTELYQKNDTEWIAALRQRGDFTSAHGEGKTIGEALRNAWHEAQNRKRLSNREWHEEAKPPGRPLRYRSTMVTTMPKRLK